MTKLKVYETDHDKKVTDIIYDEKLEDIDFF